ncbi:MAG: hypothetical protein KAT62_08360 [Desulfuromonadales bacterium]|nr:hypothetical protein [Chloroflexota bacterium]MCK4622215.1 hypothetical protein [Desulfuromonadales bacterium]
MKGSEISKQIQQQRNENLFFVRWWRKENDFADHELLDSFLENLDPHQEFESFELLDMEQMWEILHRENPEHISRDKQLGKEVILWERPEKEGEEGHVVCPFTPESIMTIFDVETKGNVIV